MNPKHQNTKEKWLTCDKVTKWEKFDFSTEF